jgi:hypothetical protein
MPVSQDILRTYRAPRRVMGELYAMGPREDRAIAWLMIGCFIVFVSYLPALQRSAVLEGANFQRDMVYGFISWLTLWPLGFYALAFILFGVTRMLRPVATAYGARLAVFWGWLAATPLALFYGLLVGFNGLDHPGTVLVGAIWLAALIWFWINGLIETSKAI